MNTSSLLALLILAGSGPALAQSNPASPYIGGGVGYALSDVAHDFGDAFYSSVRHAEDSATGYKLYGGVLWGHWGVEVGYYDFGKYQVEGGANNSVADKFATRAWAVSAVGQWPVSRELSLTGKLGVAPATTKYSCVRGCTGIPNTDTHSTGVLVSLGLGWHVSPRLMLRADWDAVGGIKATGYSGPNAPESATYSYNMFSVGLDARF